MTRTTLSDLITVEELQSITDICKQVNQDTWFALEVDGIPVGRYAAYLSLIRARASQVGDITQHWNQYLADLKASLLVVYASTRLFARTDFDLAFAFNGLYGPERCFAAVAESIGVNSKVVDAGVIGPDLYSTVHTFEDYRKWELAAEHFTPASVSKVLDRQSLLVAANHQRSLLDPASRIVFSSARDKGATAESVNARFGIPHQAEVVICLLSSPDELLALEVSEGNRDGHLLREQEMTVRDLREYCLVHSEVHVIVRVHPRSFTSRRSSPASSYLLGLLEDLPPNMHVDAPPVMFSIYDLIPRTSAAVTTYSTAALEFLAFGLPAIVTGKRLLAYPRVIVTSTPSVSQGDFEGALGHAIASPANLNRMRDVYRWWAFVNRYGCIGARDPGAAPVELNRDGKQRHRSMLRARVRAVPGVPLTAHMALDQARRQSIVRMQYQMNQVDSSKPNNHMAMSEIEERQALESEFITLCRDLHYSPREPGKVGQLLRHLEVDLK